MFSSHCDCALNYLPEAAPDLWTLSCGKTLHQVFCGNVELYPITATNVIGDMDFWP